MICIYFSVVDFPSFCQSHEENFPRSSDVRTWKSSHKLIITLRTPSRMRSQNFLMLTLAHSEHLVICQNCHLTVPINLNSSGLWSKQENLGCYSVYLNVFLDFCAAVFSMASFPLKVQGNSLILNCISIIWVWGVFSQKDGSDDFHCFFCCCCFFFIHPQGIWKFLGQGLILARV